MTASAVLTLMGGLGLFLLGIHHLTEGLKSLAGESLRRVLQRLVAGRFSAVTFGALFTTATQSSTATSLTVIGFVSAGLVTLSQAIAVIAGATLGTTSTPWMVAIFGFRVRIADGALPILGIGAFLWLIGSGRMRSLGAILAGFGLIFTGIEYLQTGMKGVSWNLDAFAGEGIGSMWMLAGIGVLMTLVMQSSSAAGATTLVALNAGSLTFVQGCAMIVGQSVGSAATTALVTIGGSLAVRRAALAHIAFSLIVGVLAMVFIAPLSAAANWVGAGLGDVDGVLGLAAFSSIFKFAGIVVFYPWLDHFARFIVKIYGDENDTAVSRLDPALAKAGGALAIEAAWRATLEVALGAVHAIRRRLVGESVVYQPPLEAVQSIERFLETLSLETTDLGTIAPRLVRLCHALDHLSRLHVDVMRIPPVASGWQPPDGFEAGAVALDAWLELSRDPKAVPDPTVYSAIEAASKQLRRESEISRTKLLEDIALQRTSMAAARADLDLLTWANGTLYHAWRLAESLRAASGK
ncbi:phosphate:Na+ symporter [Rhizobium mesoamericanum]|uniref:Na/Pi cotransporter family protein n=1 Tax=Rhizobium mesoamericanum TaxID=1079800 RepID=UPI002785CC6C|nr:Na/Pi symporter [Rhizobium mesoamericanum]MDQ0563584.1 phosphate:Na+ symporter [Rhizobium mesoamericanum]